MSGFEVFLGFAALFFSVRFWFSWYSDLLRVNPLSPLKLERVVLATVPLMCAFGTLEVLLTGAAHDVRESVFWMAYYSAFGAAWIGLGMQVSELLGVSVRDHLLERRNRAALWVSMCALVALTAIYTGGNVGEGPGAEAVVASAGLATICFFVLWWIFERTTMASERITIERDNHLGVRVGILLILNGLILGNAAAGDWVPDEFLSSFATAGWPSLVVTSGAILVERSPRLRSNAVSMMCIYLLATAVILWRCVR